MAGIVTIGQQLFTEFLPHKLRKLQKAQIDAVEI